MNDMLKEIFDQVQAEEELKNNTKAFLLQKTKGYTKTKMANYQHFISAAICFLLVLIGGHWFYFTPTVELSIDINPSIELGINRFDTVISVNSYNEDGQGLMDSLDIKYMDYTKAMDQILDNKNIIALLSNNEIMTIGVIGTKGAQSSRILSDIESCIAKERNTYCYFAHPQEVESAHQMGLSYGKYRAFLEMQVLDPNITPEKIKHMTMREIHDCIADLSSDDKNEKQAGGYGYHSFGNKYECGKGCGRKSNQMQTNDE